MLPPAPARRTPRGQRHSPLPTSGPGGAKRASRGRPRGVPGPGRPVWAAKPKASAVCERDARLPGSGPPPTSERWMRTRLHGICALAGRTQVAGPWAETQLGPCHATGVHRGCGCGATQVLRDARPRRDAQAPRPPPQGGPCPPSHPDPRPTPPQLPAKSPGSSVRC